MDQIQIQENKLNEYRELLEESINKNEISSFQIYTIKKRRNNIYVEKDYRIESTLKSNRDEVLFHVYKEFEDGLGDSTFSLSESDDVTDFKRELKDAVFICSQSKSKKYTLPKNSDSFVSDKEINYDNFYDKEFISKFDSGELNLFIGEKIQVFKGLIKECSNEKIEVKLNAFEFHSTVFENSIETSDNISKSYTKNTSYVEFVLTAINLENKKETEHVVYHKVNDLLKFDFEGFFKDSILTSIDTSKESKAPNHKGKVILLNTAVKDFFTPDLGMNAMIAHCSARFKYLGMSKYELGKEVVKSNLDKVTIYSNPLLKNSIGSGPYDDDGISSKRLLLVENSVFKSHFASKQYADYLGIEPTGPVGTIEVLSGEKSVNELQSDSDVVFEIVTFSSFVPDILSGDFSAEIRLGYKIENGVKTSFKGGLFTGNIFKLMQNVELSKEQLHDETYLGPKAVKFHNAEIVGM